MEKYIINGVEVEYDTFDLVNMELYDSEVRRISEAAEAMQIADKDDYLQTVRAMCEDIMDSFDTLLGEGASKEIFGGKVNAKVIPTAWKGFIRDVASNMASIGADDAPIVHINREQRRAAERAKRKEEARARVAQRHET